MEDAPRKSDGRQIVEAVVEGGLGMVPIVGSPLAVAFAVSMGWAHSKRMQQWLDDLAAVVTELHEREEFPGMEALAEDDVFVDAVVNATRAAQATHQQEKLDALRNGVCNSVRGGAPELDEQARFFRLIEEFTPSHLHLLAFADDPGAAVDRAGAERSQFMAAGRSAVLELIPEFTGRRDWYDLLFGDLNRSSLVNGQLHAMQTGESLYTGFLTPLGERFLAFVADPRND